MVGNRNFLPEIEAAIAREAGTKSSPVFLICRAGYRSAHAARQLIAAGYTNVWNVVEGFEGDRDRKTGQPTVNGWRNAGLPWRYTIPASAGWKGGAAR